MEDVYLCCASVSIEWKGMISVSRQATIFRHIVTNRFFATRKNRGKSSVFPSSWLKSFFLCFISIFRSERRMLGRAFLPWKRYISLVSFYRSKLLFSGFFQLKGNFLRGENNSKYRDCTLLSFIEVKTGLKNNNSCRSSCGPGVEYGFSRRFHSMNTKLMSMC